MGYIHGLGDEQERLALQDTQNDYWIWEFKCPTCKEILEILEWEYGHQDEDGYEIKYTGYCNSCDYEWNRRHYEDMRGDVDEEIYD